MKKIKKIFILCLALLCFSVPLFANPYDDRAFYVRVDDGVNFKWSEIITFEEYDIIDTSLIIYDSSFYALRDGSYVGGYDGKERRLSLSNLNFIYYSNNQEIVEISQGIFEGDIPPFLAPVVGDLEDFITLIVKNLGVLITVGCLVLSLMLLPRLVTKLFQFLR